MILLEQDRIAFIDVQAFLHVLRTMAAFLKAITKVLAAVCRLSSRAEEGGNEQRRPQPEESQRSAAQRPAGQPAQERFRSAERVRQPMQVSQPVISVPQHL